MFKAEVICHSINQFEVELVTFVLEYPRFIHDQLLTHRVFSRNTSSSRAVPVKAMIENVKADPVFPTFWGKNKEGMSASEELTADYKNSAVQVWEKAMRYAIARAEDLLALGVHKQIVNRLLDPFQFVKVIVTTTDLVNWFSLRNHKDAQPEILYLANLMLAAYKKSKPFKIFDGEWHLPFINRVREKDSLIYSIEGNKDLSREEALKISVSLCAQISFRKEDLSIEKADKICNKLSGSDPKHMSPYEHQGTPISKKDYKDVPSGKHNKKELLLNPPNYSGNFKTYYQYRKFIEHDIAI